MTLVASSFQLFSPSFCTFLFFCENPKYEPVLHFQHTTNRAFFLRRLWSCHANRKKKKVHNFWRKKERTKKQTRQKRRVPSFEITHHKSDQSSPSSLLFFACSSSARFIIIVVVVVIMRATLIGAAAGGTTTTAARGGGGGGKRGGKRGASRTPFVLALREEKTTTTTTTTILRNECFERGRRRRKATNDDAFDHRFRTRALFEKTPAVDGLGGAEEEEETKKTKKEEENAPTKREEEEEEEKEKKRRARTGNGTSSSSSSSSSGKSLGTSNGISFSSISSPASAFVSSVLSSTAAAAAKKKETKKTKTDWETSSSSSSSSFSRRRREDEDEIGPLLIGWGDAVEVTIDDGDDEVGEEEDENVQDYENEARGAAEGDANGEKDGVVTVAKGGSSSSSGEKILSSSSVLSTQQQQQQQQQQTTTTTTGKTKATSSSARAGSKSIKSSSRKDGSSSSSKREEIKSLSAYPYQNVAEQSVEARREQLLNAIDWGVVENGEEALRIFDEQVAKSQSQEKSSIEMFFDETPNARIFLKFVVFPAVFSQTMNYSFIEPYFDAEFDSMGENVAAEMLPMHLRQDILQNVERNEQMREYEIQMGRAPQLTDKQKIQARIKDAKAIEEKTIKERKKELSNRWTDVAFISAFFMSFFGRRSAAKDWIDQTKNWFFDLGPANQAFILLLSSDVLVGYHSADGWNTVLESLGEKYGISDNHAAISIFTALVPVGMDVLFKFWVFKYLRKLAPSTQIILDDIDRH